MGGFRGGQLGHHPTQTGLSDRSVCLLESLRPGTGPGRKEKTTAVPRLEGTDHNFRLDWKNECKKKKK